MTETNININYLKVAVKDKTFEKFNELMDSLPKEESKAKFFDNQNNSYIELYHNQETNRIVVLYGYATKRYIGKPFKIAEIKRLSDKNILGFYFNYTQYLIIKGNDHYYKDLYRLLGLMNKLLKDEIFKIDKVREVNND